MLGVLGEQQWGQRATAGEGVWTVNEAQGRRGWDWRRGAGIRASNSGSAGFGVEAEGI